MYNPADPSCFRRWHTRSHKSGDRVFKCLPASFAAVAAAHVALDVRPAAQHNAPPQVSSSTGGRRPYAFYRLIVIVFVPFFSIVPRPPNP